jgi:hypothetical protein
VVEQWKKVSILLNLQCVIDGATSDNLTYLIVENLLKLGRFNETKMANKLVCFGADGMTIVQGLKFNITR